MADSGQLRRARLKDVRAFAAAQQKQERWRAYKGAPSQASTIERRRAGLGERFRSDLRKMPGGALRLQYSRK